MTDPVVLLSTGDVVGPNSATSGTMVLFDGTSGKKIKGNNAVVTQQGLNLLDDVDAASNRATIGLNLVNNTSDINKPVSTAQQTALDLKATVVALNAGLNTKANKGVNSDITSITGLTTMLPPNQGGTGVSSLTALKSSLSLNLVTNTSDLNKPVSTAQQAAIDTKATKATTLSGYGITDAIPNINPLPLGSFDLHGDMLAFVSAGNETHVCQNCYWNGVDWMRHSTAKPAVAFIGADGTFRIQRIGAGANPIIWANGSTNTVRDSGDTYSSAQVDVIVKAINTAIAAKATKATTLRGYGITDGLPNLLTSAGTNYTLKGDQYVFISATNTAHMCQNAAWNGSQWNRLDTSLGGIVVLAMNGQLYVQPFAAGANPLVFPNTYPVINSSNVATEAAAGVIPVAAQTWVDAGNDDSAAVTPKKLRWGVSMSLGPTGFLALPSWLGGVIFNWGRAQIVANNQRITFSKAYPTEVFIFLSGTGIDNSGLAEVMNPVQNTLNLTGVNVHATQATEYPWLSIGR